MAGFTIKLLKTLNCSELGKLTGYHCIIPAICKIFQYLEAGFGSIRSKSFALWKTSYVLFSGPSICKIVATLSLMKKVVRQSQSCDCQ